MHHNSTTPISLEPSVCGGSISGPGNTLTAIPDSIGDLTNLVSLDPSGGPQLSALPDPIGNLVNLETLDLRGNRLTSLPASFVGAVQHRWYPPMNWAGCESAGE